MRVVGPYAVFGLGMWVSPAKGSNDFFAAAAQVVPVLMLVLAWDAKAFRWRPGLGAEAPADLEKGFLFATRGLVFLSMIYAEIVSLRGLGGVEVSELNIRLICGAIVAGLGGIAALTMLPQAEDG